MLLIRVLDKKILMMVIFFVILHLLGDYCAPIR